MDTRQSFSATMQPTPPADWVGLPAVHTLFQTLHLQGIRYCHWKSNLRLVDALNGRTDLDLLVDPAHKQRFQQILVAADIKRVKAPRGQRYPELEDYLGFDSVTGTQIHLHIHYQLVLGEQFVKNYHLPLENLFLDSVILSQGVYIPAPELELIVLSMRALLKYRDRDGVKDVLKIRFPGVPKHIKAEIEWLLAQTTLEQIQTWLDRLDDVALSAIVLTFLDTIQADQRDGYTLLRLRQQLRQVLRRYQRYHRGRAKLIYFWELWQRRNSFLRFAPKPQMTVPHGGLTLALVGVDGAGKTTLTKELTEWLSWKLDVHTYYLGSKQPSWPSRWSYLFFRMGRRSHRELSARIGETNLLCRAIAGVRNILLYSHYLFTGVDRYRRYQKGGRKSQSGSIVVYDRYPLKAPLDGPQIHLLADDQTGRGLTYFSRLEQQLYEKINMPDVLFVLEVSPEVSIQRKPDHAWETIVHKHAALEELTASMEKDGLPLQRIDVDRPLAEVLSHLKASIWEQLGNS